MRAKKKINRGLCKDKKVFTKTLKEEISLNVAKEGVKVTLKSKLKEDLDIDSLEAIEMLLDLEDKYNVEIDNTLMDFNKIKTVGHLRDFLFDFGPHQRSLGKVYGIVSSLLCKVVFYALPLDLFFEFLLNPLHTPPTSIFRPHWAWPIFY